MHLPREVIWPYLAENLAVFDEAFGLAPGGGMTLNRAAATVLLFLLPAVPARYYAPLLEDGAGERKTGRSNARRLLSRAPDLQERLFSLLDDSRQEVRAGVAQWLGERGEKAAIPPLRKRLAIEKSETARAALYTALKALGEDLTQDFDLDILLAEAQKGLQSLKGSKLDWLSFKDLPLIRLRSGTPLPVEVLRWWSELAVKLKQPGGNALFEIYLDQLLPEDATRLSIWVLESWIAYDTARPSEEEANNYARTNAPGHYQSWKLYRPEYTEEQAFAQLKAERLSHLPNSGAPTKGILALGRRASPVIAAERVRAYLKTHGRRTAQASALLELLAGIGDTLTLQALIATSLRLKQKGVQRLAGQLVTRVAQSRGWTRDELGDRTIPTAGFDGNGVLPCGEDGRVYEACLGPDLTIRLRNPAGRDVSGLPSGKDGNTKDAKKQLSTTRKTLVQVIALQSTRLYEALCTQRVWKQEDWRQFFHAHPLMRRLIDRLIWVGIDAQGSYHAFRPTPEGEFTDAQDNPIDLSAFSEIRLAHRSLLGEESVKDWEQHLIDYEVIPLFNQLSRPSLALSSDQAGNSGIEDRKGWLTDGLTIRAAAARLGYERGPVFYDMGGYFYDYQKAFPGSGITAVISFTGNSVPEQAIPASLLTLCFTTIAGPGSSHDSTEVRLAEVPPVLLSECWNDYHELAAQAVYDPEWAKKSGG